MGKIEVDDAELVDAILELLDVIYLSNPNIALLESSYVRNPTEKALKLVLEEKAQTVRLYTQKVERGGLN